MKLLPVGALSVLAFTVLALASAGVRAQEEEKVLFRFLSSSSTHPPAKCSIIAQPFHPPDAQ